MPFAIPVGMRLALLAGLAGAAACAPTASDGHTVQGKLSSNGLVLHEQALRQLSEAPLGDGAFDALAATADGRELARYLALCALPEGEGVAAGAHWFPGALGLAPAWATRPCDGGCQRWVSACLLAHANASGEEVAIALRGPHPELAEPVAEFTFQEGAFYGNVFGSAGTPADAERGMYACLGRGFVPSLDGEGQLQPVRDDFDPEDYLRHRLCAAHEGCPIVASGLCGLGDAELRACDHDAGWTGAFDDCYDPLDVHVFGEVITVYLQE